MHIGSSLLLDNDIQSAAVLRVHLQLSISLRVARAR